MTAFDGMVIGALAVLVVYSSIKLTCAFLADRKMQRKYEIEMEARKAAWDIFHRLDDRIRVLEAKK